MVIRGIELICFVEMGRNVRFLGGMGSMFSGGEGELLCLFLLDCKHFHSFAIDTWLYLVIGDVKNYGFAFSSIWRVLFRLSVLISLFYF